MTDELDRLILVIHNVAMRESNIPRLQELNATKSLLPYLQSKHDKIKLTAYVTLADVVSEEEADKLATSRELAAFLLEILRRAFKTKQHRHIGWSTTELVRAVRRLARNDANKRLLVQEGVLPLLTQGVKSELDDEKADCMEALWVLSFDKNNRADILKDDELLSLLNATHDDRSLPDAYQRSANGLLFQLRDGLSKYKSAGEKFSGKKFYKKGGKTAEVAAAWMFQARGANKNSPGHVMMSYQWDDQALVKDIRDCLTTQGFKVWMDIDDMSGSTLQAMGAAVENSIVVAICMSQRYKDSPNCRAEAEYAFQKRKQIVPLITQRGYEADGWLGMILGAKLFYDFSGKYPFQSRMDQLIKHVRETQAQLTTSKTSGATAVKVDPPPIRAPGAAAGRSEVDTPRPRTAVPARQDGALPRAAMRAKLPPIRVRQSAPTVNAKKVKSWDHQDIRQWLHKFGLNGPHLEKLTGNEVVFLRRLRSRAPEFFYKMLEQKLLISTLSAFSSFTEALDSLPTV